MFNFMDMDGCVITFLVNTVLISMNQAAALSKMQFILQQHLHLKTWPMLALCDCFFVSVTLGQLHKIKGMISLRYQFSRTTIIVNLFFRGSIYTKSVHMLQLVWEDKLLVANNHRCRTDRREFYHENKSENFIEPVVAVQRSVGVYCTHWGVSLNLGA